MLLEKIIALEEGNVRVICPLVQLLFKRNVTRLSSFWVYRIEVVNRSKTRGYRVAGCFWLYCIVRGRNKKKGASLNSRSCHLRIDYLQRMSKVRNGNQKGHERFRELRRTPYIKCLIHVCTLYFKKLKGWTKSYFIFFLKLNDHPTRCFNFGLGRIHPNGCMFEFNF